MLETFPFVLLGFHADNGPEYINKKVATLLEKLLIEFTKSRSRQTNDNALVESKNGAIVRKQFGYSHIRQHWAPPINDFNEQYLNPYINYNRPCFFPENQVDAKGCLASIHVFSKICVPRSCNAHKMDIIMRLVSRLIKLTIPMMTKFKNQGTTSEPRWGQERRLEFIDFRLRWNRTVNRGELVKFFRISIQQASNDLAYYSHLAPRNMEYDKSLKTYKASAGFRPAVSKDDAHSYLGEIIGTLGWFPPSYKLIHWLATTL